MKKKVFFAAILGALIAIAVTVCVAVTISLCIGDGTFHAVTPMLIEDCHGELRAVLVQFGCSILMGAALGAGGCVYSVERWSLLKQTVLHFLITSLSMLPTAYVMHWMPHSVVGFLLYVVIFLTIYVVIWLCQYFAMRKTVQRINARLGNKA